MTVYLRDLEHILIIVAMAWQFLSPVIYSIDMVPEEFVGIFMLNPMTPIIAAYRDIFYYGKRPEVNTLLYGFVFSLILLIVGHFIFDNLKKHFAEEM